MQNLHEIICLLRSRFPIIIVESREEQRIIDLFNDAAKARSIDLFTWNIIDGMQKIYRNKVDFEDYHTPDHALRFIWKERQRGIYILNDFHPYTNNPRTVRLIREIAQDGDKYEQTIVFLSHNFSIPSEIKHLTAQFELKLPNDNELRNIVYLAIKKWGARNNQNNISIDKNVFERLIRNFSGLSVKEVERLTYMALSDQAITHEDIEAIAKAKYDLLNKDEVITYEHETTDFSEVGGLLNMKEWLEKRRSIFLGEIKVSGLNSPKGILLLGIQGSGKSLAAKAVAKTWGIPLLRLDFGSLYDKYHGETERKTRDALKMAERMAPCVLWLDEIEKGISVSDGDGGTSKRVLGTLLTWMAERKSNVFIVSTANDIQNLPPELLRKGRMDEIFFVDLPDLETRKEILKIHLNKRELDINKFDLDLLANSAEGFSGAELEEVVVAGLYSSFGVSEELCDQILLDEIKNTSPLSVVMSEQIDELRSWANERTVPA